MASVSDADVPPPPPTSTTTFSDLPFDVWVTILSKLDVIERMKTERVCQRWREASLTACMQDRHVVWGRDSVCRYSCLTRHSQMIFLKLLITRCANLESLPIQNIVEGDLNYSTIENFLKLLTVHYVKLKQIDFITGCWTAVLRHPFVEDCRNMAFQSSSPVTLFDSVRKLQIFVNKFTGVPCRLMVQDLFPKLESVTLMLSFRSVREFDEITGSEDFSALIQNKPHTRISLSMLNLLGEDHSCISSNHTLLRQLVTLEFRSFRLRDEDLDIICGECQLLQELYIPLSNELTDRSVKYLKDLPALTVLCISRLNKVTDMALMPLVEAGKLVTLQALGCTKLTTALFISLTQHCRRLQRVEASEIPGLDCRTWIKTFVQQIQERQLHYACRVYCDPVDLSDVDLPVQLCVPN